MLRVAERLGRVGGWSIDVATRQMTLSTELRQILGMTDDVPMALDDIVALFRPEFQADIFALYEQCAAEGTSYEHVSELHTPAGEEFWIRSVGEAEYDEDGAIVRVRGATVDVTAQRRAEMRLREQASLLDITADAVVVRDLDGRITYWNRGAERLYGWPADEVIGANVDEIVKPVMPSVRDRTAQVLAGGTWSDRVVVRQRDGTPITVDLRLTAVPDAEGTPRSVLSVATDVTERVRTQERLEFALDAGGIGAWQAEDDGAISWRSRQFDRIFGYDVAPTAWDAALVVEHVVSEDQPMAIEAFLTSGRTGRVSVQCRIRRPDDEVRFVAIEGRGVVEPDGQIRRLRGTIVDVTDRVELEERLAQSQKLEAVGQLTGGIAHDFNNLLTVIVGSAELLNLELEDQPRLAPLAAMIQSAAEKGASLTQRLLAFGRRQTLRPMIGDASTVILTMNDLLSQALKEDVELICELTDQPCPIFIDPGQFEAALMNLCINASDAMPDGGQLRIATAVVDRETEPLLDASDAPPGPYVRVIVSDDGVGMSHEVVERAFEPFFSTKDVGKGTGLGLPMVYGFLRQSGGFVRIDSTVDVGTAIVMCLPLASASHRAQPSTSRGAAPIAESNGESILVVEDDELLRDLAVRLLVELGYTVVEAPDGPAAAAILRSGVLIDLLFTDVVMPGGVTGVQLADIAREVRPGLPILFTSGYAQVALEGTDDQAAELLHKPYRRSELAGRVRAALDGQA